MIVARAVEIIIAIIIQYYVYALLLNIFSLLEEYLMGLSFL
ncbi:MAG: hypothetical protein N3C61_01445 [Candidatus Micrarchaeota archaeon]|nr:hypothetical protein [Candidatus Micrarchaeota archaeon]